MAERAEVKDGGRYYCKMTNPQGGYVVSNTVTLSVGKTIQHSVEYMSYTMGQGFLMISPDAEMIIAECSVTVYSLILCAVLHV